MNFCGKIVSDFDAKICTTGSQEIISYSRCHLRASAGPSIIKPIRRLARTLVWNQSKMRRVGAAKCTHAQTLPSMYMLERSSSMCLVITASKLRGPFNERRDIIPWSLCWSNPGSGWAIYKHFHASVVLHSRDISTMKKTDINLSEPRAPTKYFPTRCVSGRSFLRDLLALRMTCFDGIWLWNLRLTLTVVEGRITWAAVYDDNWRQLMIILS